MTSGESGAALIGVDWGTSSLRAFLVDGTGQVLDRVSSSEGIMQVAEQPFEAILDRHIGPWLADQPVPVLASGMITSRNGWVETPYATLPLDASELARVLVAHRTGSGLDVHFVTGATVDHAAGPDVMRGEETQIIGAAALGLSDGLFVLPGTHSKWVRAKRGRIETFATYMTGEVYGALKGHTILGTLVQDGPFHPTGFDLGLRTGFETKGRLLQDLFHVRTLPLMGKIDRAMVADYLSGLLIGSELGAELAHQKGDEMITIVGRNDLADRYEIALQAKKMPSQRAPDDCVAMGHFLIARAAGLVR
ncbi:MAG: 2-dehydro-3-deoxygalactonokinase [Pseudomonadota bacterium]